MVFVYKKITDYKLFLGGITCLNPRTWCRKKVIVVVWKHKSHHSVASIKLKEEGKEVRTLPKKLNETSQEEVERSTSS